MPVEHFANIEIEPGNAPSHTHGFEKSSTNLLGHFRGQCRADHDTTPILNNVPYPPTATTHTTHGTWLMRRAACATHGARAGLCVKSPYHHQSKRYSTLNTCQPAICYT